MLKGVSLSLFVVLVGCGTDDRPEPPAARLDLRSALHVNDVTAVGLAIGSDGQRYVFEEWLGLLRVDGDQVTPVMSIDQMPAPDKPVQYPITDIVALAPNLFAMTAIGDGFLLDLNA